MMEMALLEQVDLQNFFPEVPIEFRVLCGNPESRPIIPLRLGILKGWLGTWVAPELLAVSGSKNSLESAKEFTLFCNS